MVAPFTGAWIEIIGVPCLYLRRLVAPFTGAWIEIGSGKTGHRWQRPSHPSRVRGLK